MIVDAEMWLAAAVNVEETNKNKKLDKLVRKQCDQMMKSKVAQNFPNVTQKVPTTVFTKKRCFIEIARKSPNILATLLM